MEIDEFWAEKEREIQEKIINKCMVQYLSGYRNFSGPLWGVFFFTKQAIYLQTFPKRSWLSAFQSSETENSKKPLLNFRIPWSEITNITFPEEKSKIIRLFSRPGNLIIIDYLSHKENLHLHLLFNDSIDILKESSSILRIGK